jgi:hypothetical protein
LQDALAREMIRVTKPGGRIVMGNWIDVMPTIQRHSGRLARRRRIVVHPNSMCHNLAAGAHLVEVRSLEE